MLIHKDALLEKSPASINHLGTGFHIYPWYPATCESLPGRSAGVANATCPCLDSLLAAHHPVVENARKLELVAFGRVRTQVDPRGGRLKHRCSYRKCHVWMNPHHLHPLFTAGQGPQAQSLQMQAAHILLKLHRIPQSKIHFLLDINHKAIEDMEKKICKMRQEYVEQKEKEILLGKWSVVEGRGGR